MTHCSRHRRYLYTATFAALTAIAGVALGADQDLHRVWAVKDARIVTLAGPPVEKGTVIIRDGLIEAVGAGLPIPKDAEVIDGAKLTVYPGLIDGLGQALLKLPEEKIDRARLQSGEFTDKDRGITPALSAYDHVSLGKAAFDKYNRLGFVAGQVLPDRGLLTGRSAFFCFGDPDKNKALVLKDACLGIGYSPANFAVYPNSLMGVNAYLKQALADAAYYEQAKARWLKEPKSRPRPAHDPNLEVLADYAAARKPVIFFCRNRHDIRRSLALAAEFKLDFFIADLGGEAFEVLPELQKAKARVLCTVAFKAPGSSLYAQRGKAEKDKAEKELYPKNPLRLAAAGLPFAFSSLGTDDPKAFAEGIQKAVEAGLTRDKALEALTRTPAAFFGLDRVLGTIEPGKIANLVLAEGELPGKDAKVRHVFADGLKFDFKEAQPGEGEKPTVNVTGKWEMTVEGMGLKTTVELTQEGAALSGRMALPFGVFDFTDGLVAGSSLSFEVTLSAGGQDIDLFVSGSVEGEKMTGTLVQGGSGSAEFTAKRVPGEEN